MSIVSRKHNLTYLEKHMLIEKILLMTINYIQQMSS